MNAVTEVMEQLRKALEERDEARAEVAIAYRRGAEAMREQVMAWLVRAQAEATVIVVDTAIRGVHKLPVPEDK